MITATVEQQKTTYERGWMPKLQGLARLTDHKTVEALLIDVVGDFTAGLVLYRLMGWFGRGKRKDGYIYKSDREFYDELRLSRYKMRRARERLAAVVDMTRKKANGAPTTHYRLNLFLFVERLCEVVPFDMADILSFFTNGMMPDLANSCAKLNNGLSKNAQTITNIQSNRTIPKGITNSHTNNGGALTLYEGKGTLTKNEKQPLNATSKLLVEAGIYERVAIKYGYLPAMDVRRLIEQATRKKQEGEIYQDVQSYIAAALPNLKITQTEDSPKRYGFGVPDDYVPGQGINLFKQGGES